MASFAKKPLIPESVVEEGTAKRNILRKGGVSKGAVGRKETAGKLVDDGYVQVNFKSTPTEHQMSECEQVTV